jgi:hypothetical protein
VISASRFVTVKRSTRLLVRSQEETNSSGLAAQHRVGTNSSTDDAHKLQLKCEPTRTAIISGIHVYRIKMSKSIYFPFCMNNINDK